MRVKGRDCKNIYVYRVVYIVVVVVVMYVYI